MLEIPRSKFFQVISKLLVLNSRQKSSLLCLPSPPQHKQCWETQPQPTPSLPGPEAPDTTQPILRTELPGFQQKGESGRSQVSASLQSSGSVSTKMQTGKEAFAAVKPQPLILRPMMAGARWPPQRCRKRKTQGRVTRLLAGLCCPHWRTGRE